MKKTFLIGVVLCLCAVIVPATASAAQGRAAPDRASQGRTASRTAPGAGARMRQAWTRETRAGAFVPAAPAQPVTGNATITADPSTGLLDGQSVAVTGSGLVAKTLYGVIECQTGSTDITGCDIASAFTVIKTDATGSFSTSAPLARTITPEESGTPIDCATAGACVLAAAPETGDIVASTPISFADVAIIPPTLSADPSTGLLDGQKIAVSGTNFTPGAGVFLVECPVAEVAGDDYESCFPEGVITSIPVDASGDLNTTYKVTRILVGENGPVDCAQPSACELAAFNAGDPDQSAVTPLSFADVAIVPPVMTATPATSLDDGQDITVTGKGFRAGDDYLLSECVAGSTDGSQCVAEDGLGNVEQVEAKGHAGRFSVTFQVARVLTLIDGTVDCAQAPGCVIGAIDENDPFGSVDSAATVSFDPSVKPLPPLNLSLHINPTGQIVAGGHGRSGPEISGSITCDRPTATPVSFQMQVTEPSGGLAGGPGVEGVASCQRSGGKFSITIPTPKKDPAVPGIAGVLMAVSAVSGSATGSITISASVTLKASS
jgi:neocarzinostatin family protein